MLDKKGLEILHTRLTSLRFSDATPYPLQVTHVLTESPDLPKLQSIQLYDNALQGSSIITAILVSLSRSIS